jgi:hypothetical protein
MTQDNHSNQVQVPYAILRPSPNVKLRTKEYKKYPTLPLHLVQSVLYKATVNSTTPIIIDLETTSALAHSKKDTVAAVSLASSHSVVSINVKDNHKLWLAILNYLYTKSVPLIAHNASFDMAWMLRDFNPTALYYHEFKLFNFVGCTYAMYRHLATEGFRGQQWSLDYAQKTLLQIESNKIERNKKLVEQGLIKKRISNDILLKLLGSEEEVSKYQQSVTERESEDTEDEDTPEED